MTISLASSGSITCAPRAAPQRSSLRMVLTVWAERRALAHMDTSRLMDMGISPSDAALEIARPFWDLPDQRRC